jgi:hypothetical protein
MTEKRIANDGEAVAVDVAITDEQRAERTPFVMAIDATPLTGVQRHRDGYMAGKVRAARTGVQTYLGKEVGWPERETVAVYRPLDEVMRLDALGSYKGKPITDGHPKVRVTSENWGDLARGTVMGVQRDGDAVALDVTISAKSLVDKLESGEARELSAGYVAKIDRTPGTAPDGTAYDAVQRDLYIDHLAVVPKGRAGSEFRVGDGADWGARPLDREIIEHPKKEGQDVSDAHTTTVTVGDGAVPTTEAGAIRIKGLQDSLTSAQKSITDKDTEIADLKKQIETKDGEIAAAKKSLEDATKPEALADAVKQRGKVTEAGKKAGMSEEDMDKMDDAAIRRAVVAKSLGDEQAKAMSDAAIEGAFAFASQGAPTATRTHDADLGAGIRTHDADPWAFMDEKKGA